MRHTRRQILEAIEYWTRYLKESVQSDIRYLMKNPPGDSGIEGTFAQIVRDNMAELNKLTKRKNPDGTEGITHEELHQFLHNLLDDENSINPGWKKWFFAVLDRKDPISGRPLLKFSQKLWFINNIFQKECGYVIKSYDRNDGKDVETIGVENRPKRNVSMSQALKTIFANIKRLNKCKTVDEISDECKKIFEEADLDVDALKIFFVRLEKQPTAKDAMLFIADSLRKMKILKDENPRPSVSSRKDDEPATYVPLTFDDVFSKK